MAGEAGAVLEAVLRLERNAYGSHQDSLGKKTLGTEALSHDPGWAEDADGPPQTPDARLDRTMAVMQRVALNEDLVQMEASLLQKVDVNTKVSIAEVVDVLESCGQ